MRLASFVPSRSRSGKVVTWRLGAVALTFFACCGSVGFIAIQSNKKKQEALVEADALYPSKPAEAIVRYKEGYDVSGSRKAEVLQKIVDHETANGGSAEATKWIERGLDEKIAVTYTSALAKDLHAKAQKDRADRIATKQADETAKKIERDSKAKQRDEEKGAKAAVKANKNLPRDQFRALVSGKTEREVLDALGKPDETQDQEGLGRLWYYRGVAVDPVTGKKTAQVQLVFDSGVVTMVNFN